VDVMPRRAWFGFENRTQTDSRREQENAYAENLLFDGRQVEVTRGAEIFIQ